MMFTIESKYAPSMTVLKDRAFRDSSNTNAEHSSRAERGGTKYPTTPNIYFI